MRAICGLCLLLMAVSAPAIAACSTQTIARVGRSNIMLTNGIRYIPTRQPQPATGWAFERWQRGDRIWLCDNRTMVNKSRMSATVRVLGVIE